LSVQKLEFIAWSDWLVGSHMASWLAEHKARRRGAHKHDLVAFAVMLLTVLTGARLGLFLALSTTVVYPPANEAFPIWFATFQSVPCAHCSQG
jgi:prolipoprotein diacylglyceryltransferase